jgi:hypothetical protein
VAAAAGGKARLVAGLEGGCKGPQTEEQGEEDGENAPHPRFMLHEDWIEQASRKRGAAVRYHRFIAYYELWIRGISVV